MKVYDSQGRLKTIASGASVEPTSGQFSVLSNQVSVADAALSTAINVVSNALSDLVSAHNVLSNRVSANSATGGAGSVTSNEASAISAQAASAINVVSNALSNETSNRVSADGVLSAAITIVSNAASAADLHASTASAAATSADAHANTVSARVVSASAELVSLIQIASAAATSADAHANTASAAATSADAHANTVSARLVSASAELVSLIQIASAAATSADSHANTASAAATSADAHANTVSARLVSASAELVSLIQIASAAATSADVHANTASAAATSVNNRVTSVNATISALFLLSLRNRNGTDVSAGSPVYLVSSGIETSAFALANASLVSTRDAIGLVADVVIADTAAGRIQYDGDLSLSAGVWDARTGDTGGLIQGAKYYIGTSAGTLTRTAPSNARPIGLAIDNVIMHLMIGLVDVGAGGTGSVTSTEAQAISAQAASAINVVSARVVSVSAELASLVQIASAAATSADGHANTVSVALSADHFISLQNVDATSMVFGQPVRMFTSADTMKFADATAWNFQAAQCIGLVADTVIAVSAVGRVQHRGKMTFTSAQIRSVASGSSAFTIGLQYNVTGAGIIGTGELTGNVGVKKVGYALNTRDLMIDVGGTPEDQNTSSRLATLSGQVSVLSLAHTSINSVLSNVSTRSVGNISTRGLQSALDALSNRISGVVGGTGSVTSTELSAVSAQAASAINVVSARAVSISAELASLVQIASAAATSADGHANTVSARAVSISAELASLVQIASAAATSADGHADTVSARLVSVSAEVVSLFTSVSATLEAHINAVSAASTAGSIAALSNAISNDASVSAVIKTDINSVSAAILADVASRLGSAQFKMVTTGTQAVATATFTKVSGLSLSIVGSGFYEIHGQIVWSQSGGGSASAIFNFGMSMTAQPVMAMFRMQGNTGALGAAGALSAFTQFGGNSAICGTPSIMYSAKPNPGVSGSVTNTMFFDGVLQASTAQSQLKVVVACSTGAFGVAIQPGSWIRAYKIG